MAEPVKTRQFGRYVLERLIGRGGMGEIFLAHAEGPGGFRKRVVIKKILPHLLGEQEFVTRFIDEANIVVSLTHGNIVPVFDMGEVGGQLYIAMEYIHGRDLRDVLKAYSRADSQMPAPLAAYVVGEICKALSYAHKKTDEDGLSLHIIHRDISPSNVLVSREGVVKLTDFGIAKAASRLGRSITGRLQGKFCYMSPEQASGQSVDHRSDLFSLGALAYELFTGHRPFEDESDLATLDRVKRAKAQPPSAMLEGLPEALDPIILKAVSRDPSDRYQDAADFASDLLRATRVAGNAGEAEMATELARLFPGEQMAPGTPSSGMRLDDVLAMEAERLLLASPLGESPTLTAPASSADSRPSLSPQSTPYPSPQFTPQPLPVAEEIARPRPFPWLRLVSVVGLAGIAAILLWVAPGYLLTTSILVQCDVDGAQVLIDNNLRGFCPVEIEVGPGSHLVQARQDHRIVVSEVSLDRGERRVVELALASAAPHVVSVTVDLDARGGQFSLDGETWRDSGVWVDVAPGEQDVWVRAEGIAPERHQLAFSPERTRVEVPMATVEAGTAAETPADGPPRTTDVATESSSDETGTEARPPEEQARPEAEARVERVRVRVTTAPEDATVLLDGEPVGQGAQWLTLASANGPYRIGAQAPGYQPKELSFDPRRDRRGSVELTLEPAAQREVRAHLGFPGRGDLYVDGELVGEAPTTTVRLSVGRHHFYVHNAATGDDDEAEVEIVAGEGVQVVSLFRTGAP